MPNNTRLVDLMLNFRTLDLFVAFIRFLSLEYTTWQNLRTYYSYPKRSHLNHKMNLLPINPAGSVLPKRVDVVSACSDWKYFGGGNPAATLSLLDQS